MRTLAIDCATEACSVALFDGRELIAGEYRVLGRGHAEQLVPMIAGLPGRGRAERILASLGPGSFTGVRVGISAARALALAWRAEVLGYPTLALVAAMARRGSTAAQPSTVCMAGGHGEWFVQDFGADGLPEIAPASLAPPSAGERRSHVRIAGNRAVELAMLAPEAAHCPLVVLPDAHHALLVPRELLSHDVVPIYGRGPDARLPR